MSSIQRVTAAHASLRMFYLRNIFSQDKTRFLTYVVAAGLPYGGKEDIFHYFFKVLYPVTRWFDFWKYIKCSKIQTLIFFL